MKRNDPLILFATWLLSACAIGQPYTTRTKGMGLSPDPSARNPFRGVDWFIQPAHKERILGLAATYPAEADRLAKVAAQPSAVWLDTIGSVARVRPTLEMARAQQQASGRKVLTVFVVYNMPNRDCSAEASNGELFVEQNGEARYQREFIDPIAAEFAAHPEQPVVVIYEPDSLANLATNMGLPKCKASRNVYKDATIYALRKFALSNVSVYLDAAHAGWLGWDDNRNKIAKVYKQVLHAAGGKHLIRGFATNLANYGHLTNRDLAKIEPTNPCANELEYVRKLNATLILYGLTGKGFVIDTSRNGRGNLRSKSGYWCNLRGAGLGERPKVDPETDIDAYFWIKTPGESDGVSDPSQPRFDPFCVSPDSVKNAPQAGQWFESYFLELVRNAEPPL